MYVIASQWKFGSPAQAQQATERFRAGFTALIEAQPGLVFWYLVATGADEALTLAAWQTTEDHARAQPILAAWLQEHLAGIDARVQRRRGMTAAEARPPASQPGGPPGLS